MIKRGVAVVVIASGFSSISAFAADKPTRFWNLTHRTIVELRLAPAGTSTWGGDQCKNDRDGEVDQDERLRITDTTSGRYDARLRDKTGTQCTVRNIAVREGAVFSMSETDLTDCERR